MFVSHFKLICTALYRNSIQYDKPHFFCIHSLHLLAFFQYKTVVRIITDSISLNPVIHNVATALLS